MNYKFFGVSLGTILLVGLALYAGKKWGATLPGLRNL